MNLLKKTRCYLAGNIEYSSDSKNWRKTVKQELEKIKIKVFSPLDITFEDQCKETDITKEFLIQKRHFGEKEDLDYVSKYMQSIVRKDLRMVDLSDFVIFKLEIDKPTFGTMHELVICSSQKKPIFIILDKKKCPLWLYGIVSYLDFYDDEDEVIDVIYKINKGELMMDQEKWRLLKENLR